MRKVLSFVAAALIAGLTASTASAGPLAFLTLEASSDGVNYFQNLQVAAGTTYDYEVVFSMAPVGTVNGTHTITSLTSADGSNSMQFQVNDTIGNTIPVTFSATPYPPQQSTGGTLSGGWGNGIGANPGTLTATDTGINTVRPVQSPGVFAGGTAPVDVMTGTFTTPTTLAAGLTSLVDLGWSTGGSGSLKINGGTSTIFFTQTTETGASPLLGYNDLTLTTPAVAPVVPEPASLVMMGLGFVGVAGLMVVRRRRMA